MIYMHDLLLNKFNFKFTYSINIHGNKSCCYSILNIYQHKELTEIFFLLFPLLKYLNYF